MVITTPSKAGILLVCLFVACGCNSESPFKKEASKATDVAKSALAAVQGGTCTYGDFTRIKNEIDDENTALSGAPRGKDTDEVASESLFLTCFEGVQGEYEVLDTNHFLEEKLHDVPAGISPAFSTAIGSNEISDVQTTVSQLTTAYSQLR